MPLKTDIDALVSAFSGAQYFQPTTAKETLAVVLSCCASSEEAIVLIKARTDTEYFQTGAGHGGPVCFIRGRLRYPTEKSSSPFPSALLYFGPNPKRFAEVFSAVGMVKHHRRAQPQVKQEAFA